MKWMTGRSFALAGLLAVVFNVVPVAYAQDPFEIHVLAYETLNPAEFTFETHMNYVGMGTNTFNGSVAPSAHQFRMTYELTGGITDWASLGFMQMNAALPGESLRYAGWRVVPHFYAPRSWRLPLDVGLVTEFAFERPLYSDSTREITIIPVLEKNFGRLETDWNPAFSHATRGPAVNIGWVFEPAARLGYARWQWFTPSLEYYGGWGSVPGFLPVREQVHQFLAGGDLHLPNNLLWSMGVGVGVTPSGDRLVYKTRLEFTFGQTKHATTMR